MVSFGTRIEVLFPYKENVLKINFNLLFVHKLVSLHDLVLSLQPKWLMHCIYVLRSIYLPNTANVDIVVSHSNIESKSNYYDASFSQNHISISSREPLVSTCKVFQRVV